MTLALADPSAALRTRDSPSVADHVRNQLLRDYPPDTLAWISSLSWTGPSRVPLSQVDRAAGKAEWAAAAADKAKIQLFRKKIAAGFRKPVILVRPAGGAKLFAVDGHSRITASEADGWVSAYIGTAAAAHGAWESVHSRQLANDGAAVELSAQTARLAVTPAPAGKPGGPGLWRVKGMELPPYFQNVRDALIRGGHAPADAYRITWGAIRRWAHGGGKAHPEVVAAAQAALADLAAKSAVARSQSHAREPGGIELAWDAGAHPRVPAGSPAGGQFGSAGTATTAKPAPAGAGMNRGQRAARAAQLRAQAGKYRERAAQIRREIAGDVATLRAAVKTQKAARAAAAKTAAASASGTKAAATTAASSTAAKAVTTSATGVTITARARSITSMRSHVTTLRAQARALDAEASRLDAEAKAL